MFAIRKKSPAQANKEKAQLKLNSAISSFSEKKSPTSSIKFDDAEIISMSDEQFQQALYQVTDNHQRERMLLSRLQHLQRMALELTQQLAELHAYDDIHSKSLSI